MTMTPGSPTELTALTAALAAGALAGLLSACAPTGTPGPRPPAPPAPRLAYPETPTVDQVDDYHGVAVADPYRWLEDTEAAPVREWLEAQARLTASYLERHAARPRIRERLTALWDHERFSVPLRRGGRLFYTRNDGLQAQPVLHVLERLDGEPRALLDPNALSADGTVALVDFEPSVDGSRLAYALSTAGSDWLEWRVRDVGSGEDLADRVQWSKFSRASWTSDGRGFFYSRYDAPELGAELAQTNYWHKLYYHRLGTPQDKDLLIYQRRDRREWGFDGAVTDDGRFLVIRVASGTDPKNGVFYKDLRQGLTGGQVVEMLSGFDARYDLVGNDGWVFWFATDNGAPRGRLVAIDARAPAPGHWRELVPESADTLERVTRVGDRFFARYLSDAHARVALFDLAGRPLGDLPLPGLGSVEGLAGDSRDADTFYSFSSFTAPPRIFRYDLRAAASAPFREPRLSFDPEAFETRQVFFASRDGTRVPMFLCHRRGLEPDGALPTLLYGYGGFGISRTPEFSPAQLLWMEMGGVFAVANLRGGGEYGEEWHQAGTRLRKQNVFDDAIAAAEWLIANGSTRPERLAVIGRSNGGLLVGALITQRPDLFAAAVPIVGVLDMLRFPKFTIGWAWVPDYGSPDDPEEFRALHAYSPLHNLRAGGSYPATLVVTGDHDDRVFPAHSFKFAAALQAAQAAPRPVLLRVDLRAGHGSGKPTAKQIDEWADILSFLAENLNLAAAPAAPAAPVD